MEESREEGAAAPSGAFRNLTGTREFWCLMPDINPAEADKNKAYVVRAVLPSEYRLLGVMQVTHPLKGVLGPGLDAVLQSTLVYTFLVNPKNIHPQERLYITSVFPDRPFPWSMPNRDYGNDQLDCVVLGTSSHSGIPLLHAAIALLYPGVLTGDYDRLEEELKASGYIIVPAKKYDMSSQLLNFYAATQGLSEPHTVSEPATREEVMAGDNLVIKDLMQRAEKG